MFSSSTTIHRKGEILLALDVLKKQLKQRTIVLQFLVHPCQLHLLGSTLLYMAAI